LGDPETRRKYDELGTNWKVGVQSRQEWNGRAWPGADDEQNVEFRFDGTTGFSDFFEEFFGRGGRFAGFADLGRSEPEPFGETSFARHRSDIESDILVTLDEVLQGAVRTLSLQRIDRRTGQLQTQTLNVRIPPGVHEGQVIRVLGIGNDGTGRGGSETLYLRVRLAAHPDFQVRGADLYYNLDVAPWEAVLGTKLIVPTLKGHVSLRIPAGTNNGQQLRVRGHGLPTGQAGQQGDLYVVINVQLPQRITKKEGELWEQLSRISKFNPRTT